MPRKVKANNNNKDKNENFLDFNEIDEDIVDFSINKEFAARFEHNKKREERMQLEEKYGDEYSEEDSEEDVVEDEVGELVTPAVDAQILKTMLLSKQKQKCLSKKASS
jgi:protein KRI1